jgi:hypothetical protein
LIALPIVALLKRTRQNGRFSSSEDNVYVMVLKEKISYSSAEALHLEDSFFKRQLGQFQETDTGSVLHKKGISRPLIDAELLRQFV